MATFNHGDRLAGRFLLVRALGAGATGETWLADDPVSRQRCVVKCSSRLRARATLAREAELLERVAGPGVARVVGLIDEGERCLLVTGYLGGGDLRGLRARPWREIVAALLPALAALERAHALGLVHCDLKPANLVRGDDGAAALVDFGTAGEAGEPVPGSAPPRGSPFSRSPAQWQGRAPQPADDAYGVGALLYELLSGAPPFYPEVDAQRVVSGPVPALHAVHPLPEALAALVAQLLASNAAQRASVTQARELLASLLADTALQEPAPVAARAAATASAALTPPPQPMAPAAWRPAAAGLEAERVPRRSRGVLVASLALGLVALAVFVLLPRWAKRHPPHVELAAAAARSGATPAGPAGPAARDASAPRPLPSDPQGLTELAQAKTRAEEARVAFEKAQAPLVAAHAELWGGADWTRLTDSASRAAQQYERRDYAAATADWAVAREIAGHVGAARAPALAAALTAGRGALTHGDATAAGKAFERALAIEPGQKEASAGLARARHLDAVLALVDAGGNLEKSGELAAAADKYRAALALDPATGAATAGLARLAARQKSSAYAQAMAQGQRALAAGDRVAARSALERAAALAPGAPEVRDALAQIEGGDRNARIAQLRGEGESAERAERWGDAVKAYEAARALDPTLVFAQEGRARAQPRAELAARLDGFVQRPERLTSSEGRSAARATLTEAAGPARGEAAQLRRQIAALEAALLGAETPVRVALSSDNLTDVVVYRVARLGPFEQRELELLPGRYTVVGRRSGFRDVRRELVIAPGAPPPLLDVRCNEAI